MAGRRVGCITRAYEGEEYTIMYVYYPATSGRYVPDMSSPPEPAFWELENCLDEDGGVASEEVHDFFQDKDYDAIMSLIEEDLDGGE